MPKLSTGQYIFFIRTNFIKTSRVKKLRTCLEHLKALLTPKHAIFLGNFTKIPKSTENKNILRTT